MPEGPKNTDGQEFSAGLKQGSERRIAFVVGNSAYHNSPLKNPRGDAEAFAEKLAHINPPFEVELALDATLEQMEMLLETFEAKLNDCDTALLFFAGHGIQVKGVNYLIPVDAEIRNEIHLRRRAFSLTELLELMSRRVRNSCLVFLDACRENPFARSLQASLPDNERGRFIVEAGLAEVRAGSGSFVAYATAPGNVALDGIGKHSPFTGALLNHMDADHQSIGDTMVKVCRDVLETTNGRQEPWTQSALREVFCFNNSPLKVDVDIPPVSDQSFGPNVEIFERAAIAHWETIRDSHDPRRLQAFLKDYGDSRMAALARDALQESATRSWRRSSRKDQNALMRFAEDFAGTAEAEEARTLIENPSLRRKRIAAPRSLAAPFQGREWGRWLGLSAIVFAFLVGMIWQPWRTHPSIQEPKKDTKKQQVAVSSGKPKPIPKLIPKPKLNRMPVDYTNQKFVTALQDRLYDLNFYLDNQRGQFDKLTYQAIVSLQKKLKQPANGELTATQWLEIQQMPVAKIWGAVAYTPRSAFGTAFQHTARRIAEDAAHSACLRASDGKSNCNIVAASGTQCLALAKYSERWDKQTYYGARLKRGKTAKEAQDSDKLSEISSQQGQLYTSAHNLCGRTPQEKVTLKVKDNALTDRVRSRNSPQCHAIRNRTPEAYEWVVPNRR